jgi:hypothetical protein
MQYFCCCRYFICLAKMTKMKEASLPEQTTTNLMSDDVCKQKLAVQTRSAESGGGHSGDNIRESMNQR